MATGLRSANEEYKKRQASSNFVRKLQIKDGEKAWFRYLATGEDNDHRYQTFSAHRYRDDANKWQYAYCTMEELGSCKDCLEMKASAQFGVWLWVEKVLRKRQNPALGKYDNAKPWRKVEYGKKPDGSPDFFYCQDINDVRLWNSGPGRAHYIFNQIIRDFDKFGTLMDRVYVMSRQGEGATDTMYTILPTASASPLTDRQVEVYQQLPPVVEVISGRAQWPPRDAGTDVNVDDGEEVEKFDAPEPEPVVYEEPDIINMDDEDEAVEVVEVVDRVKSDNDEEISEIIDAAMKNFDSDDDEEPVTPIRRGKS